MFLLRAADKVKEHQALVATRRFNQLIFPFVRAIHAGVLDLQHSTVILSRHGRFGAGFEQWCKLLAQDLRDEGLYSCDGGAQVAQIIATTLQNVSRQLHGALACPSDAANNPDRPVSSTSTQRPTRKSI